MTDSTRTDTVPATDAARTEPPAPPPPSPPPPKEVGGPKEKDPTRYGDWTVKGRCIDF